MERRALEFLKEDEERSLILLWGFRRSARMRAPVTTIFWLRPPWTEEEVASSAMEEFELLPPPATVTSGTPLLPLPFGQPSVNRKNSVSIFLQCL